MSNKQTVLVVSSPKIAAKEEGILPFFGGVRQSIEHFCSQSLPTPYSGLLAGMLLGFRSTLLPESSQSLRVTGLSHVLVIDGMKITLIAGFLISFLRVFFQRRVALFLSIVGIGIYMILSGLEVSALRAGIMGIVAFSAQTVGRQYKGMYALFLTSGALMFWDPLLLLNAGFQLSVAATAGIMLLKPLIPLKGILLEDMSLTLAAQIATLPILLGTFGSVSLLSVPVHALVMWTIPPIMLLGGMGAIVGLLFQPLGGAITSLSLPLLWYFQTVANFFAQFGLQVQVSEVSLLLNVGWYLLLFSLVLFVREGQLDT
jgi:competence protein ComEC